MSDDRQPHTRIGRGARLGLVAMNHASRTAVLRAREPFMADADKVRAWDHQVLQMADDLTKALGSMKGAAMKLGQVLSLLNLGLSSAEAREEFSNRLAPLFRRAPAVDNATMFALLDRELGKNRNQLASIEPEPIASASLGQVYRGTLIDGRTVAIKVQYPSAQAAVRADLKNLALLARMRRRSLPDVGLDALVAEVSDQIRLELDYRRELTNHRLVYEDNRGHPVFRIAEPIDHLCTDRVLVTDYLDGLELDEVDEVDQDTRDWVGEAIYRFYCGSLYTSGRFCADPHPGNVMLMADRQVGFVDFGLYVRMAPEQIDVERTVFAAVMRGDAETAYHHACAAGFIVDEEAMPRDMAMDYLQTVASWHLTPGVVEVTPKTVHKSVAQAMLPRSQFSDGMYRQRVPREHAFSRRTDMSVCGLLGDLHARGPWRAISEEWILGGPPATAMGEQIARWRSARRS